jgi:hypothetical protein
MVDPNDVRALRVVRTEMTKHGLDVNRADIRVMHGVCYIRGIVAPLTSANMEDVELEFHRICRLIRQRPEIRDVVHEAQISLK